MTTNQTDHEAVAAAFKAVRKHGIVARMHFSCCGSCASYELSEKYPGKGRIFYSRQHEDAFQPPTGRRYSGSRRYQSEPDGTLYSSLWISWSSRILIFSMRRSSLRRTVGYVMSYAPASSLSEPDASRKRFKKARSSSFRWSIHILKPGFKYIFN